MPPLLRRHLGLLLLAAIGALLVAVPQIDLAIAGLFHDPIDGFYLRDNPLVRLVFHGVPWITRTVVVGLMLFLLAAWTIWRRRAFFLRQRRAALDLLLGLINGPGRPGNTLFTGHAGRAR